MHRVCRAAVRRGYPAKAGFHRHERNARLGGLRAGAGRELEGTGVPSSHDMYRLEDVKAGATYIGLQGHGGGLPGLLGEGGTAGGMGGILGVGWVMFGIGFKASWIAPPMLSPMMASAPRRTSVPAP